MYKNSLHSPLVAPLAGQQYVLCRECQQRRLPLCTRKLRARRPQLRRSSRFVDKLLNYSLAYRASDSGQRGGLRRREPYAPQAHTTTTHKTICPPAYGIFCLVIPSNADH